MTDLPVGRELDARVVEVIFGMTVERGVMDYDGLLSEWSVMVNDAGQTFNIPTYSTDIAGAWLLLDEMAKRGWQWWLQCLPYADLPYMATLCRAFMGTERYMPVHRSAKTAPEAICRTVLAALSDDDA